MTVQVVVALVLRRVPAPSWPLSVALRSNKHCPLDALHEDVRLEHTRRPTCPVKMLADATSFVVNASPHPFFESQTLIHRNSSRASRSHVASQIHAIGAQNGAITTCRRSDEMPMNRFELSGSSKRAVSCALNRPSSNPLATSHTFATISFE